MSHSKFTTRGASFSLGVNLTEEDLKAGVRHDQESCPVAIQFKREIARRFRRWKNVEVEVGDAFVIIKANVVVGQKHLFMAKLPEVPKEFILAFDNGNRVAAGGYGVVHFELDSVE